jgi:hypothetical protein
MQRHNHRQQIIQELIINKELEKKNNSDIWSKLQQRKA